MTKLEKVESSHLLEVFCFLFGSKSTLCWHNCDQQTLVIAMNKDALPCLQLAVLSFCCVSEAGLFLPLRVAGFGSS